MEGSVPLRPQTYRAKTLAVRGIDGQASCVVLEDEGSENVVLAVDLGRERDGCMIVLEPAAAAYIAGALAYAAGVSHG